MTLASHAAISQNQASGSLAACLKCCSLWDHSQFFETQLILGTKPVGNSLGFSRSKNSCAYPHVEQEGVSGALQRSLTSQVLVPLIQRGSGMGTSFCSKIVPAF